MIKKKPGRFSNTHINMGSTIMVPCTACRYCVEDCPKGLDIPKLISMYNEISFENPFTLKFTTDAMTEEELPGACVACGACSKVCPQSIEISDILGKFDIALKEKFG